MSREIELFVKSKTIVLPQVVTIGRPIGDHYCTIKETYRYEKIVPPEDKNVQGFVRRIANEKGWIVKEYDMSTFRGRLKAFFRRIRKTPSVVMEGHRVQGEELAKLAHSSVKGDERPS